MNSDNKLKEIINRVSNRNSVEPSVTEELVKHFFSEVHKELAKGNIVLIHNFGSFIYSKYKLEKSINTKYYDALSDEEKIIVNKMRHIMNNTPKQTRSDFNKNKYNINE